MKLFVLIIIILWFIHSLAKLWFLCNFLLTKNFRNFSREIKFFNSQAVRSRCFFTIFFNHYFLDRFHVIFFYLFQKANFFFFKKLALIIICDQYWQLNFEFDALVDFFDKVECSFENLRCFVDLVKCLRRIPRPNFLPNGPRSLAWHCTKLRVQEPSQAWNSIHLVNISKLTSKYLKKKIAAMVKRNQVFTRCSNKF